MPVLRLETGQRLLATPGLVTYAEVLALPVVDLDAYVERALADNPALELAEPRTCPRCGGPVWRPALHACGAAAGGTAARSTADRTAADPGDRAAVPTVAERLLAEAAPLLAAADRPVAAYLVADLDPRGFLDRAPEEIAADLRVPPESVDRALAAIRAAGPPGIATRDLRACLLAQLDALPGEHPVARALVADHLDAVAGGRYDDAAAALGCPVAAVAEAVALIRARLRPYAVLDAGAEAPPPPPPDLFVVDAPGGLAVELADGPWAGLGLAAAYRRAAAAAPDVREALRRAAEVLSRLDGRAGTLRRVAERAVRAQEAWVRTGPAGHRPLTRAEVARDLGVHESTVSRAVAGKHLRLPRGEVVPLAALFGTGGPVREALRGLVAGERSPLSDAELAAALGRLGHRVARRSVAKYRAELGIPPRDRR